MEPKILETPTAVPDTESKAAKYRLVMRWVWLVLVILLVGAGAAAAGYYLGDQKNKDGAVVAVTSPTPSSTGSPSATPTATPSATPTVQPIQDAGVTWLPEPVKADDLKLFSPKSEDAPGFSATYYRTGTLDGRDIILAAVPGYGMGDERSTAVFVKTEKGFDILQKNSSDLYYENKYNYDIPLAKSVTVNSQLELASIASRDRVLVKGLEMTLTRSPLNSSAVLYSEIGGGEDLVVTMAKFDTTPYGVVYSATLKEKGNASETEGIVYYLKRPNGTFGTYQYDPPIVRSDAVPQVTWNDGSKNVDTYRTDAGSKCGIGAQINMVSTSIKSTLTKVGTAGDGRAVYSLPDTNPTLKYFYDQMGGKYFDTASGKDKEISLAEWQAKHGMFVYEDILGRLVIFRNTVYGISAECGKPVVYLYPTKTTDVSVQVGADIRISDPEYGNGWNVKARPDGTLTTADGKTYGSLFWEGFGNAYPSVEGLGTVVAKSDVEAVLKAQLKQQGLNAKESAEFMEYWLPKMPNTPYVRLTWLGTKEMDRLAPLTVTPRPDSVIRIFLDFEGLQEKVQLKAQKLTSIPRTGFTVVEWGGLLVR